MIVVELKWFHHFFFASAQVSFHQRPGSSSFSVILAINLHDSIKCVSANVSGMFTKEAAHVRIYEETTKMYGVHSMRKLLFFDIDGTLAYPQQEPTPSTVEAIRRARKMGHLAFISTGRTIDSIPKAISRIGFDGGIFSAGGQIAIGHTVFFHFHMEDTLLKQLLLRLRSLPVLYVLETADGRFHSENAQEVLRHVDLSIVSDGSKKLTTEILFDSAMRPMSEYRGQPVFKIAYHCPKGALAQQLHDELADLAKLVDYDNLLDLPISVGEISDPAVNKGRAIRELCRHFGMNNADCIAFGDSMNDEEMLQTAGVGVAMGNASEQLKALADMVCDRCECDGIAKALEELNLI